MSMSGLELSCGEGVLGDSCKGDTEEAGSGVGKAGGALGAETGASREGSIGEAKVSKTWIVSAEDGEILGPVGMAAATGSTGGFLEGVVINLMTEDVGS